MPVIDRARCDGCGLCAAACPTGALRIVEGKAVFAQPARCDYIGYCEMICPARAIARPFEIVFADKIPA